MTSDSTSTGRDGNGVDLAYRSPMSIRPLSEREFRLFRGLIEREAGIFLAPHKKTLLVARLSRRLRALGLRSFHDYYRRVTEDGTGEERVRMLDRICTNETHFFREPAQFEFLERQVIPEWERAAAAGLRRRRIRVWSAACSSGEEPFSLAMSLLWHCPPAAGWRLEVLASDLSTRVLEAARGSVWPLDKAEAIPEKYRKRFMLKGFRSRSDEMMAGPEIRSLIRFFRLNLVHESYPVGGKLDLIFCRNVLIYFTAESRRRILRRLLELLAPGGLLFLGHSESLTGLSHEVESVFPNVYARRGDESIGRKSKGRVASRRAHRPRAGLPAPETLREPDQSGQLEKCRRLGTVTSS